MSAPKISALILGLLLLASAAQGQTTTTNYGADPQMNAPAQERRGSVLDYVIPYIPLVGPRWQEKREEQRLMQALPPPEAAPPRAKKKPVSKTRTAKAKPAKKPVKTAKAQKPKRANPQPAAETLGTAQTEPSPATVDALTQCLARFSAREVSRGSNASADHLMAQAAERDCGVEFRGLAEAVARSGDRAKARATLEVLIREKLSPAVETAMAEAKGAAVQ